MNGILGQFQMRLHSDMRGNRRLDDGGETHGDVELSDGLGDRRLLSDRVPEEDSRAVFTLAPAMWEWMSIPPASTTLR